MGFIRLDVTVDPIWVAFARILSGSFLFLTGVSLILAHFESIKWRKFFRRFIIIFTAAMFITLVTYLIFPYMFVYFGILHAIAIFSILALPFLRAPIWLIFIIALIIYLMPFFISSPIFNQPALSFIGLWQEPPLTGDLVPIFPSFAIVLFGMVFMRLVLKYNILHYLSKISADKFGLKQIANIGRWSLIIYLLHQPILLSVLYPLSIYLKPAEQGRGEAFYGACFSNCLEMGNNAPYCASYCQCSLELVEKENLWAIINSPDPNMEQSEKIMSIAKLCDGLNR